METSLAPRIAPIVNVVGAQGWIVLGLVAGAALAWQLTRRARVTGAPNALPSWTGERSESVERNAAMAS